MAVWLSGIVLLFCCQMQAMAMEVESCPLAKLAPEHCDKGKAEAAATLVTDFGSEASKCCVFITSIFEKTRKLEQPLVFTKPADEPSSSKREFPLVLNTFAKPRSYSSYLHTANKIFIKHQAFRI